MKSKTFSIDFKGLSVAKNCLRPESAPLNYKSPPPLSLCLLVWNETGIVQFVYFCLNYIKRLTINPELEYHTDIQHELKAKQKTKKKVLKK